MEIRNKNPKQNKTQEGSGTTISNNNKDNSRQFSNSNNEEENDETGRNQSGEQSSVDNTTTNKKVAGDNTIKDPDNWTTGDEPMTGAQSSYLHTLASEAGEEVEENLTKAAASKKIDELQHKTGRGLQGTDDSA